MLVPTQDCLLFSDNVDIISICQAHLEFLLSLFIFLVVPLTLVATLNLINTIQFINENNEF